MTILNKYLNTYVKSPDNPNLIFLYDPNGNLNQSYFLNEEEKINKKKYKIIFFTTSDLPTFYLYFETLIRHEVIKNRILIILSNNPPRDLSQITKPPFYIYFLIKRAFFLEFDIQKYIEKHFKIKFTADEILEKPLGWFVKNKIAIMYYRAAMRKERKFDGTILEITNENIKVFENFVENQYIIFI